MAKKIISRLLLDVRKTWDLTQTEMALRLGTTRSAYQHYERGERDVSSELLQRFFVAFRIDPVLAFFEDGEEIIDARNMAVIKTYQDANELVRRRANELGTLLSFEKERYVSETIARTLLNLSLSLDELSSQQNQEFDELIRMVA